MKKKNIIRIILNIASYAMILMLITLIFKKSIYIDNSCYGLWCALISALIFILNKTVKPILFWLTLPITGLTLGLFYPFINVIILYLAAFLFGSHFTLTGNIFMILLIAICISIISFIMQKIIDWLLKKG